VEYLSDPLGMFGEEYFEGMEFLRDAFDVIESIDADDDFVAFEFLFEFCDTPFTLGILECLD